jgi:hypothetical protein
MKNSIVGVLFAIYKQSTRSKNKMQRLNFT